MNIAPPYSYSLWWLEPCAHGVYVAYLNNKSIFSDWVCCGCLFMCDCGIHIQIDVYWLCVSQQIESLPCYTAFIWKRKRELLSMICLWKYMQNNPEVTMSYCISFSCWYIQRCLTCVYSYSTCDNHLLIPSWWTNCEKHKKKCMCIKSKDEQTFV